MLAVCGVWCSDHWWSRVDWSQVFPAVCSVANSCEAFSSPCLWQQQWWCQQWLQWRCSCSIIWLWSTDTNDWLDHMSCGYGDECWSLIVISRHLVSFVASVAWPCYAGITVQPLASNFDQIFCLFLLHRTLSEVTPKQLLSSFVICISTGWQALYLCCLIQLPNVLCCFGIVVCN